MTIAVTGSNGFIGRSLVEHFTAKGCRLLALQRRQTEDTPSPVEYRRFELPDDIPEQAVAEADLLVHSAYQPYGRKNRDADLVNREGAKNLIDICVKHETKIIFLSTMSAHENALSHYGKCKLEVERLFDPSRDLVLKLGLVIGKKGGLFMRIVEVMKGMKLIPLIGGGRQPVQTLLMDDLSTIIERAYEKDITGTYIIAEREPMAMRDLYDLIAGKLGLRPKYIPVPFWFADLALGIAGTMGLEFSFSKENLLGLKQLRAFETDSAAEVFGVELAGTTASIDRLTV